MKRYPFAFIILCTIIKTSFGMLAEVTFKPYIQVLNPKVVEQRKNGECLNHISVIEEISKNNACYRCFEYALEEITGFTGDIAFYSSQDYDIPLNDFFKQIPCPQPGCLVVYTDSDLNVKHFAVAIDRENFKSKFGTSRVILRHGLFQVHETYQDHAYFLKLLPKYEKNKQQLYQDLQKAALEAKNKANIHQNVSLSTC